MGGREGLWSESGVCFETFFCFWRERERGERGRFVKRFLFGSGLVDCYLLQTLVE